MPRCWFLIEVQPLPTSFLSPSPRKKPSCEGLTRTLFMNKQCRTAAFWPCLLMVLWGILVQALIFLPTWAENWLEASDGTWCLSLGRPYRSHQPSCWSQSCPVFCAGLFLWRVFLILLKYTQLQPYLRNHLTSICSHPVQGFPCFILSMCVGNAFFFFILPTPRKPYLKHGKQGFTALGARQKEGL